MRLQAISGPRWRWITIGIAALIVILIVAKILHLRQFVHIGRLEPGWGPDTMYWQAEVLQQSRRSQQIEGVAVFLGDSITVGLATSRVTAHSENFGINGDSIDGLLLRVPQYQLAGARIIVVEIGINNWQLDRFTAFDAKYQRLLALLPKNVPIVATAIMPVNDHALYFKMGEGLQEKIRTANRAIATECRRLKNCRFLDLSAALSDKANNLRPEYDVGDGIHLSTAAYAVWDRSLLPLIN